MITRLCQLPQRQSFFLLGPRGVGKSTLIKRHFSAQLGQEPDPSKFLWLDLLEPQYMQLLASKPQALLELWRAHKPPWVIIDEIQKLPILLDLVHKLIEDHGVRFALSGSSARKLRRGQANLLAGRAAPMYLHTFSPFELGERFQLQKALQFGLLPVLYGSESLSTQETVRILYAYADVYLKEEIASEQLVRHLDPFRKFLAVAAQHNAQIINFAKIERAAGLGATQAARHFEILEDTLMGRFLPPFHTSLRARQFKKSKFYFFDTGVVRALSLLADTSLKPHNYEYGRLFETFIINEVFKLAQALEKRWQFSYFQSSTGVEVDLVIERPLLPPLLIEIKSSDRVDPTHLRHLKRLKSQIPEAELFVWFNGDKAQQIDGVLCLPWQHALKKLFEL